MAERGDSFCPLDTITRTILHKKVRSHPCRLDPAYSAYASMKGGLIVLTRYLATVLSGRRIRVNSLAPGPTRTRIADDAFAKCPEVIAPTAAHTAFGRVGEADDLGNVIAFLLSDEAHWITAQDVEASGGFNL